MAIISYFIYKNYKESVPTNNSDEKIVEVELAKVGTIKEVVNFIGIIQSRQQTAITAKTNGTLTIISKSGQMVKKGDLIAKIGSEDIENNYKILKESEEIAKVQLERAKSLLKSGTSSKNTVEEKKSILLEAQKKLSDANISLEETKLFAPFDGVIGIFKFKNGSHVNKGDSITKFYDPKSLMVEFDLPLSVAKKIENGAQIFVNDKEYALTYIQKMLDEDTHMCPAYAEIDCSNYVIGTTVDISVVIQEKKSVIVIPFEAIFLQERKPFVYVVRDNKVELSSITCGIRDKTNIEIISGLKEGDKIISFGHNLLYPGLSVRISTENSNSKNDKK